MAEINLKDLEAIQTSLKSITNKDSFNDVKKAIASITASLKDGLEEFEKQEVKSREKRKQLNMAHMQEELKKRIDVNKKITEWETKTYDERFELSKRYHTRVVNELSKHYKDRERIEKIATLYQIARNKEFYGKIDESFKKFGDRTSKIAGKLDSVFGTSFFSSLQKISNMLTGFAKNAIKLTMGGMQFIKTAQKGGIKRAFQQTKLGQGIRSAKRTMRRTTGAIRKFTGQGVSGRMEKKGVIEENERTQSGISKASRLTAKSSEGMFGEQMKFFKWFKNWELLKMAWQLAKWGAGAIASLLGKIVPGFLKKGLGSLLGKSKIGKKILKSTIGKKFFKKTKPGKLAKFGKKLLSPKGTLGKFFGTKAGKFLGGTKGGVGTKLIKSGLGVAGAIGGLKGLVKGIREFGDVAKKEGTGGAFANVGKNVASGILSGFTMGLVSPKSINKVIDSATKLVGTLTDKLSPSQKDYDKISQYKTGLSKRAVQTGKDIESIMEKTGMKGTRVSEMKKVMESKDQWAKLNKAEQDFIKKRIEGAEKRQKVEKTPAIKAAQGFPAKTNDPKKLDDLFGRISKQTNVTVGEAGEEYMAVLNKDQYSKLKNTLNAPITSSLFSPKNILKTVSKSFIAPFKMLGSAIGRLFGKSENEKKNQDESMKKYGNAVDKGAFRLKDSAVNLEKLPFKSKLLAMITERFKTTGKKTQINSGYRSIEDQIRVAKEEPGRAAKPGRSPHGPPNPRAVDMNSADIGDMVSSGLIKKYGFKYPTAKDKSGQYETWHLQAHQGAFVQNAPKQGSLDFLKGETILADKGKKIDAMMEYAVVGKKLSEMTAGSVKDMSMSFTKDMPGRALKNLQKDQSSVESKDFKQMIKLLGDIKTGIDKGTKATTEKQEKGMPQAPTMAPSSGEANYKTRSEVFPSDTMFTNMYALVSQFSGGY